MTWALTLPDPADPADPAGLADPADSARRLAEMRDAALGRVATARAELADVLDSASSTTGDDEHDPEGATIGFERAQAASFVDRAVAHLAEVDAARNRVSTGTYGLCVQCGRPISAARLDARPAAPTCLDCA